jgi:hypothetical protein
MPNLSPIDALLLQIVSGTPPASIPDVIAAMQSIDELLASNGGGIKWFTGFI